MLSTSLRYAHWTYCSVAAAHLIGCGALPHSRQEMSHPQLSQLLSLQDAAQSVFICDEKAVASQAEEGDGGRHEGNSIQRKPEEKMEHGNAA